MNSFRISRTLVSLALLFAFVVIGLGAYTRLKDAGLGCPDWPGCYGHWIAPAHEEKAWLEMIHRYAASFLGFFILAIILYSMMLYKKSHPILIPLLLIPLVLFQAVLGMWTVTWQLLPLVVMGHLLGGITIFASLWILYWQLDSSDQYSALTEKLKPYRYWLLLGVFVIGLQIILGGWVSSNYAALSCPTFPGCQGSLWPKMDWLTGFNFFSPIGVNYQGGQLDNFARVAIHMAHRYWACVTIIYLVGTMIFLQRTIKNILLKKLFLITTFILILQITLGILNVVWLLPLKTAVPHNLVASLLLLSWLTIVVRAFKK